MKIQFLSASTYENTATINYISTEKAITKRRVVKNEGGRELKSFFLYGEID